MTIGPTSGHREFVHANLPSHAGKGEPAGPGGLRGEHGEHADNGKVPGTGNGNGHDHDGVPQGNGPRTGGNNPASEANRGNEGPHGNQGNQGNQGSYGGHHGSGSMTTGGGNLPGLLHIAPDIARQLGNTLFSIANGAPGMLRDADGRGPPAHANANANPASSGPATSNAQAAHANAGPSAHARADGVPMPSGTNAPLAAGRAQGAFGAQAGTATPATATTAANTSVGNTSASSTNAAGTAAATLSQAAPPAVQQRAAMDPAQLVANRPADAALAAGRTANAAPATAPPPATVAPPALPAAPALPSGTTAALAAAGLTMATSPVSQLADARGIILPANDAVAALRGENMLNPAGHTLDGAQRRNLRSRLQAMPRGGLARLLWAMGAIGHAGDGQAGSERDIQRAMQWLFWMLAIIAYGCVAAAIVIFVGSDGRVMDSLADRNSTAWLAMCGLATAVAAWAVARRVGRRR